jgi:hypothetical protein
MSLNKQAVAKADYLKTLRPAAALDPVFPYFDSWVAKTEGLSDAGWSGSSPAGFDPAYYEAEISLPDP